MASPHFEHQLSNGLHLLVEPIKGVQSAAFTLLVPAGVAHDHSGQVGTANLLSELVTRGAGERDSRALTAALDNLGLQRAEATEIFHTSFTAAALAKNLVPGLSLIADVLRRPRLEGRQLENCKKSALQELEAIEDEPGQKAYVELKKRALPDPLGRCVLGTESEIEAATAKSVADFHRRHYRPNGAILGVAGAVEFAEVRGAVEHLFGDWAACPETPIHISPCEPVRDHIPSDKIQTHIGVAFAGVSYGDPDYFNAHGAVGVLSGGMSARLFTEVREKRGLCYSVGASFSALKDRGVILCYAGTTSERASETLDVLLAELDRLRDGIADDEVRRVKAGLKSSLVMHEESTSARASVLARSWFNLGRVRTVEEVAAEIEKLTPHSILSYLERHPPGDYTILTVGASNPMKPELVLSKVG